jgi:hypothetical protein
MNNNLLFVHIPKTGGQSILKKLNENGCDPWRRDFPMGHDPLFALITNNRIPDDTFKFCVVRNPYQRTFSYYKHFCRENSLNVTLNEFLNCIKQKKVFSKTPMMLYPQSFYIFDRLGKCSLDKIYRHENFSELEEDLGFKFEKINVGDYSKEECIECLGDENNINLIRELYSVDFHNFNYDE